jgi:uncharacterized alkaline shock family protein YloU
MREETKTDFGVIRIHKDVISSIAFIAAQEIEGVKRVGFKIPLPGKILQVLGIRYPGIRVNIEKNGDVRLNISLVIKFGFNIPEVSLRVQENVRLSLEKMSSVSIRDININVLGIERG